MSKRKTTLKDIACEAGVSTTTASFFVNGKADEYHLSAATRERLATVIKKHNFTPNFHARAINSGKTYLIGVIIGSADSSFWFEIVSGIEEVIAPANYHMVLAVSHYDQKREIETFRSMESKGVDGYIFSPIVHGHKKDLFEFVKDLNKHKPVVSITYPLPGLCSVFNDNKLGGTLAAEYFLSKGHKKIAYIGGLDPRDGRNVGFISKATANNVDLKRFTNVADFMPRANEFSAVFCFSDSLALELHENCKRMGIKIPGELSIIGYDNMDFIKLLSPRPGTVHQYKKELGVAAAEMLMKLMKGDKVSPRKRRIVFEPHLIPGD